MKTSLTILFTGFILVGCSTVTPEQQTAIEKLTACEKVDALVGAYEQRFDALKRTRVNTKYMQTWTAKYNLVGNECQITALDTDTVTYRCQESYKQQQQAVDIHQKAVTMTRKCLVQKSWYETQKESAESLRTTFVLDEKTPVISIHTGKTLSRSTPWSTSLEIGKPVTG